MSIAPQNSDLIPIICVGAQADLWNLARSSFEGQHGFLLVGGPVAWQTITSLTEKFGSAVVIVTADVFEDLISRRNHKVNGSGNNGYCNPQMMVVVNSTDQNTTQRYIRMGAAGVLHAGDCPGTLRRAVRSVANREVWAPRKILSAVLHDLLASGESDQARKLTPRETEILELIGLGYSNQEIANRLFITKETVRWHVRLLYGKLGASDRNSAIKWWRSNHSKSRAAGVLES